jgi:hypothetical protein
MFNQIRGILSGIGQTRENGHKGVIDLLGIVGGFISVLLLVIGFLLSQGYYNISDDIKGLTQKLNEIVKTGNVNCVSIATLKVSVQHLNEKYDDLEKIIDIMYINRNRIPPPEVGKP